MYLAQKQHQLSAGILAKGTCLFHSCGTAWDLHQLSPLPLVADPHQNRSREAIVSLYEQQKFDVSFDTDSVV